MEFVYHASQVQGLSYIEPRVGTHGNFWIYATRKKEEAAMFLGTFSDAIVQTGKSQGKPFIAERFAGALNMAYENKSGSLYTLNGASFHEGRTSWQTEVVSEQIVDVVQEERIDDALMYLGQLEKEGKMVVYRYPARPSFMPSDKSDLLERAKWMRKGSSFFEDLKKFHPDIFKLV